MIPAPNLIAGVLIGVVNQSFTEMAFACFAWGFVFCAYVSIADSNRVGLTITSLRERGRRLLLGSPILTFYAIEYWTALVTSLVFAAFSYGIKTLIP